MEELENLLSKFDIGISGEGELGALQLRFPLQCEMVGELVTQLQEMGRDLIFPIHTVSHCLQLELVPFEIGDSVPQNLLNSFKRHHGRQTGVYTFSKKAMTEIRLSQLFLQLQSNFTAHILEDRPGTDDVMLHVIQHSNNHRETPNLIIKPTSRKRYFLTLVVFMIPLIALYYLQNQPWALKIQSYLSARL
jgi:hypothetical protein